MSGTNRLHTVTGATGYTGRYIVKLLLEEEKIAKLQGA